MIKLILEFYDTVCAFSSVSFVAFGLSSSRKSNLDELEAIEEFDKFNGYRRFDFDPSVDGWSDADKKSLGEGFGPATNRAKSQEVTAMTRVKHCATAPSAWSSYLMNGDASELDDNERQWCDEWIKWLGLGTPVECEDAGFRKRHDAFAFYPQATRCRRYTFLFS